MIAMRVMQVPVNEVVRVIAVRHGLVTASRTMHVLLVVLATVVLRCTGCRVDAIDRQCVFFDSAAGDVV
jgi:hypothetical protein